jgi:phosphohistidine swiveling domain-containing protein
VSVVDLSDPAAADPTIVGTKAATLATLAREGFPVLHGFVVLVGADPAEVLAAARALGCAALAVRSSALAEDLAGASHAGQYRTELGVAVDGSLTQAVERVRASGQDVRVLVQPLLAPGAAGVAFTADPVSGEREVVLVHAVRGLGERLVSGQAAGEEWRVTAASAVRRGADEPAIDEKTARAVADLAQRVERARGTPQDIEWALADGALHLLQARPMTALPDAVRWDGPPGAFARSFRLGEWIGDPVTPLFESWLLTTMEETMHSDYARMVGQPAPRPLHAVVNGWYYCTLNFASPAVMARMLPGLLLRLVRDFRRVAPAIPPLARFGIDLYVREWRDGLLPAYRAAVQGVAPDLSSLPPERLVETIDTLAVQAGHYFTSITMVAGYGWKTELPLASFYREHLRPKIGGHHQLLLRGLYRPVTAPHAVSSLDWSFPTHGEAGVIENTAETDARYARLAAERADLERRARAALAPKLASRFDRLLRAAQRASVLREEQVRDLTLAWPLFRAALRRLGESLVARGAIPEAEDVYFVTRAELLASLSGGGADRSALIAERRILWARQRRLVAPLVIGRLPKIFASILGAADRALRDDAEVSPEAIRGTPASPGRATGRARVIRTTDEFDRLQPGEILVCPLTAPAWTPLFERAAAIVTDVGSPSAHASIIAREYGIPAVVGTGDGTSRIADGALVTVDGGAGLVTPTDR